MKFNSTRQKTKTKKPNCITISNPSDGKNIKIHYVAKAARKQALSYIAGRNTKRYISTDGNWQHLIKLIKNVSIYLIRILFLCRSSDPTSRNSP